MKKINVRLGYIQHLVDLIKTHQVEYGNFRKRHALEMSIHGKDQNIKVRFAIDNMNVGELVLHCPKNDPYTDWLDGSRGLPLVALNDGENFSDRVRAFEFRHYSEVREYWAVLDILYMMALQGFEFQAVGQSKTNIFAAGVLGELGRFSFTFNVTTADRYFWNNGAPDPRVLEGMEAIDAPDGNGFYQKAPQVTEETIGKVVLSKITI